MSNKQKPKKEKPKKPKGPDVSTQDTGKPDDPPTNPPGGGKG